jgi:hypothetical protein
VIGQCVTMALAILMIQAQLRRVSPGNGAGAHWREMLGFSAALQMVWILIMLQIQSPRTVLGILGNLTLVADYELAFGWRPRSPRSHPDSRPRDPRGVADLAPRRP